MENIFEKKYETAKKDAQLLVQHSEIERKNTLNYILIAGTHCYWPFHCCFTEITCKNKSCSSSALVNWKQKNN